MCKRDSPTVDRDLNQNKTVVPLFGKGTTIYANFLVLIYPLSQSSISEVES